MYTFSLLHRVILRELVQTFLLCMVSLMTLILIGRGLQLRELFLGLDIAFFDVAVLFGYMMPSFLSLVLPISCMISVFLTFLRMSTDRELIAVKAGGISVYQILPSPVFFSLCCTLLALFVSLFAISWGMGNFRSTILEIANTRAKIVLQPGVFNQEIFGLTLFARQVDPETGTLREVVFEDKTHSKDAGITILAPTGEIITDEANGELVFNLKNGRVYRVDQNTFSILSFKNYSIHIDLAAIFAGFELGAVRPKEMSLQALREAEQAYAPLLGRDKATDEPSDRFIRKISVEIQKRWALPAACLVLGIFAFPLACLFEGVHRQLGIVLALFFFLLYYSIFSLGLSIGEGGGMPPVIGLWSGNILFAFAGVIGLRMTAKERTPSLASLLRHALFRRKKALPGGNSR